MEMDPEPPTWASIVKKEKRFSIDIQFNFVDNLTIPSASPSPSPAIINLIDSPNSDHNGVKSEEDDERSSVAPHSKRLRLVGSSREEPLLVISQGSSSSNNSRSGSPSSSEDQEDLSRIRPNKPSQVSQGVQDFSMWKPRIEIHSNDTPQDLSINRPNTSTDFNNDGSDGTEFDGVQDLSIHSRPKGPFNMDLDETDGDLIIVEEDTQVNLNLVEVRRRSESVTELVGSASLPTSKDNNQETDRKRRGRRRKDEENGGKPFICFLCNFTSPRESVLNNHMTRMHTVKGNRGNVRCTVCAYSCPSVEELRSHQELIHGGDDPEVNPFETKVAFHACTHCTKKFRSQTQLEAHLRLITQKLLWKDLKARRVT